MTKAPFHPYRSLFPDVTLKVFVRFEKNSETVDVSKSFNKQDLTTEAGRHGEIHVERENKGNGLHSK